MQNAVRATTTTRYPSLLEDGFFSEFFRPVSRLAPETQFLSVDVRELKDRFVIEADLPGVEEKDVKVEFNEGHLVLEGTRHKEVVDEGTHFHLKERISGSFRRTFKLADGVQPDKIQAKYRNGTLTVEIPKAEKSIPRTIPIAVVKE